MTSVAEISLSQIRIVGSGESWINGAKYEALFLTAGDHAISVLVSPTGKSARVFMNGTELGNPAPVE